MSSEKNNSVFPEQITPEIAGRIRLVRGTLDRASFAGKLNVSPSYITMIEKGKRLPGPAVTELICIKFHVRLKWLVYGEGEMYEKPPAHEAMPTMVIPVLGKVPAGFPENISDVVLEYISLPSAPPGAYALIVKGDSMSPGIRDGDYVLFVQDGDYKNGDVIVVNNEFGDSMIKRYRLKDGEVWLFSDNPEYPSFQPNEQYRIIGKVVKAWREIKL